MGAAWQRWRRETYALLEDERHRSLAATAIHSALVILVLVNVAAAVCETVPSMVERYGAELQAFEIVSLAVFATEFLLRLWAAREDPIHGRRGPMAARIAWLRSPAGLIDFLYRRAVPVRRRDRDRPARARALSPDRAS